MASPPRATAAVVRPRDAAAVVLVRQGARGTELYWVLRGAKLAFGAGHYACPGGGVRADEDGRTEVAGAEAAEAPLFAAAARELFEETGVLAARPGGFEASTLEDHRRRLLGGQTSFRDVLTALGARLDAADFSAAGRWLTPEFSPIRFDARFFLVRLPEGEAAEVWPGELAGGGWITPAEGLARWEAGTALLHPPILHVLETLAAEPAPDRAVDSLRAPPHMQGLIPDRIEFQRGVMVLPLRSPTLPPATHTNAYLVGTGELLLVDPGSPFPSEQRRLARLVRELVGEGRRLKAIVLTHHHDDHIGGAAAASRDLGAPIWAHAATARLLPGITRTIGDVEALVLDGDLPMTWTALHTPGHAPGHLCLCESRTGAVLCGDLVAGAGTVVIDPDDGDLAIYLASLARVAALPPRVLYPAHGNVVLDGAGKIAEYLAHRAWREGKIVAALAPGPSSVDEIVRRAYDDTPEAMHPIAKRSALATLVKLEREGRVAREGERWMICGREPARAS